MVKRIFLFILLPLVYTVSAQNKIAKSDLQYMTKVEDTLSCFNGQSA